MDRRAYLLTLMLIVVFFGVSMASVRDNNLGSDDNTTSSETKSQIIHAPVVTVPATERGQLLYKNHCTACHTDSVHSRRHGKAHSINEIRQWVLRWSRHLELDWKKHDVDLVTDFLNRRYYHFTTEK